ncbi:SET domain-containing protein-lysine N-methyltransferase [Patescibacteria group bacterium]|nr:SET domain-containing protein-lysine N-methyltransferase [Patescibacteria group bacterium]
MEIFPPQKIKITAVENKGRGVIATEKIFKDEIIEYCPLIILKEKDSKFAASESDTIAYYYLHQLKFKRDCVMLGYASLYNHSFDPNADVEYENDPKIDYLIFRAIKDIDAGEEITWNYNFDDNVVDFLPTEN